MHDSSRWTHRIATIDSDVRINYIECGPLPKTPTKGTILLIHGFPQTSYQFRHVITPLADKGFRVIAPDYRGAGKSSHPLNGFTKSIMAEDLFRLVHDHLGIKTPIHVVGHDIGGMVAHAYASRHPESCASLVWGECPLPGTDVYDERKVTQRHFHFIFHAAVPDLVEALVRGREEVYLKHFYDKLSFNTAAISQGDVDEYVAGYSKEGAMRCGVRVYEAFEEDKKENREWLDKHGKCGVPSLVLSGKESGHGGQVAKAMGRQMYENWKMVDVEESGHYIAEENPEGFMRAIVEFVQSVGGKE